MFVFLGGIDRMTKRIRKSRVGKRKGRTLKRSRRALKQKAGSRSLKRMGSSRVGKQRGGIASVTAPTTILSPLEQSRIFLYPLTDNFRNDLVYTDSRIPFLNVSI
jgi:hypothetical protein